MDRQLSVEIPGVEPESEESRLLVETSPEIDAASLGNNPDLGMLLDAVRRGHVRSVWCRDLSVLSANPNGALEITAFLDWHDVPLHIGRTLN